MSQSQNGTESCYRSHVYRIDDPTQIGEARRCALSLCRGFDASEVRQGRINIVITELGTNIIKYAPGGMIVLRVFSCEGDAGIEILALDKGAGFADVSLALNDGYTTGTSPGTGLGAVKRLSDDFDIYSRPVGGTGVLSIIYMQDPDQRSPKHEFVSGGVLVPIANEDVSGDGWGVRHSERGVKVIMVDGLGHGPEAHAASDAALRIFNSASDVPQELLLSSVHKNLRATRGAAVFLASYSLATAKIDFVGAGNIRAFVQGEGKAKTLISQNGTAGVQMRTTRVMSESWDGSGFLVFHSDGLKSHWDLSAYPGIAGLHPALAAGLFYRDHNRNTDDSSVLVIKSTR